MHEAFVKYVNSYASTPLGNNDIELIKEGFFPKRFRKKQYLLQEGEVSRHMAFIVKGAMRKYSVDHKGAEHIVTLLVENWLAGDRESFVMLTPSIYNVDAWEDTDVLMITRADQVKLFAAVPALNELSLKLDERHAFAAQKRLNDFISLPAEKRYYHLAETYPEFLQRFPQHIIASYLGITKETLSRVRKQAMKK